MTKPENLYLLVNILNTYLYYFVVSSEFMAAEDISTLSSFIKETVDEIEEFNEPAKQALKALQNCRAAIADKAEKDSRFNMILQKMPGFEGK